MFPPNNLATSPPAYFMEVKNFLYEPISTPQYQNKINFAKSSPPIFKNDQFCKIISPMLNINLHPCQTSVILVTFMKYYATDQKTSSIDNSSA